MAAALNKIAEPETLADTTHLKVIVVRHRLRDLLVTLVVVVAQLALVFLDQVETALLRVLQVRALMVDLVTRFRLLALPFNILLAVAVRAVSVDLFIPTMNLHLQVRHPDLAAHLVAVTARMFSNNLAVMVAPIQVAVEVEVPRVGQMEASSLQIPAAVVQVL